MTLDCLVPPGQKRFVPSCPTQSRDWETTSACVLHVLRPIGQHAPFLDMTAKLPLPDPRAAQLTLYQVAKY
jgi:hypothetical protein